MENVWLFVLGVVIFVVGLALSIALHEIGHLVPAKLFGVRVRQYMIGFGPTLFSRTKGETEYGVKAIPLGGYISMSGMFPPGKTPAVSNSKTRRFMGKLVQDAREASDESMTNTPANRAFFNLPVYKRIIIMLGGPFMNLVIAFVLFSVLLMGFGQVQSTNNVASVSQCVLAATSTQTACAAGDPVSPGAAAGILPGDTLVSFDGQPLTDWNATTAIIRESAGRALSVVVIRDGAQVPLTITPVATERLEYTAEGVPVMGADGKQAVSTVGFVGISPQAGFVPQPVTAVIPAMGANIAGVVNVIANLPERLGGVANAAFGSGQRDVNGPISVVGVGRVAGEIASTDLMPVQSKVASLISVLASLNIALFVFNLIPLLPLDGGHIAGAIWESLRRGWAKLRKKVDPGPFDTAKLMPVTFVVFILLMGMSALLIYADVVKPVNFLG
ncbi:site-2 protease family protein [Alpinimonas psychrophila]|uniref:site-2 protease family protein n=1 Tax=Alpinimonas psychrophila TaxID=748908 RepID=UPI0015F88AC7